MRLVVIGLATCLVAWGISKGVQAQSPFRPPFGRRPPPPLFVQPGVRLLRRMMEAERTIPYTARESTLRADGPGTENIVKSDPARGLRREPANGKGRVLLDNYQNLYRFSLIKPGEVLSEESRLTKEPIKRILDLVRRLSKGVLTADIVGQDTIAGRGCDIVEVRAIRTPDTPTRRFWIDRETGLRLRTEEKDATGKVLSGSYYTTLDLTPQFAPNDFTPPTPRPQTKTSVLGFEDRRRFKKIDEARKAGFDVHEPSYMPSGYTLRQVEATGNGSHIALRYANGLNALSITALRDGVPPRVQPLLRSDGSAFVPFPQGKNGLFIRGANGGAYLLLGDLSENELRKIAASVR